MAKADRKGRVFIDWSQNDRHKTTICAYSLRIAERPTVSTPLTWDEVHDALDDGDAGALVFEAPAVLERVGGRRRPLRRRHSPSARSCPSYEVSVSWISRGKLRS